MHLKEWPPEMSRADLMTVSEAAAELGYRDGRQIRAAIRDGRLDGYRPLLGRAALVARADVDRLNEHARAWAQSVRAQTLRAESFETVSGAHRQHQRDAPGQGL